MHPCVCLSPKPGILLIQISASSSFSGSCKRASALPLASPLDGRPPATRDPRQPWYDTPAPPSQGHCNFVQKSQAGHWGWLVCFTLASDLLCDLEHFPTWVSVSPYPHWDVSDSGPAWYWDCVYGEASVHVTASLFL